MNYFENKENIRFKDMNLETKLLVLNPFNYGMRKQMMANKEENAILFKKNWIASTIIHSSYIYKLNIIQSLYLIIYMLIKLTCFFMIITFSMITVFDFTPLFTLIYVILFSLP